MFKESFDDMRKVFGRDFDGTVFNEYERIYATLDDHNKYNIMRLFTIIMHKQNTYCPRKMINFQDVQDNEHLHRAFMLCFNYATA